MNKSNKIFKATANRYLSWVSETTADYREAKAWLDAKNDNQYNDLISRYNVDEYGAFSQWSESVIDMYKQEIAAEECARNPIWVKRQVVPVYVATSEKWFSMPISDNKREVYVFGKWEEIKYTRRGRAYSNSTTMINLIETSVR